MTQSMQQTQTMKQTYSMTQKNQQALEILKMDSRELMELVLNSVQQNPFLDFHPQTNSDEWLLQNMSHKHTLQEDLYLQLHTCNLPYDEAICSYLIESLDTQGFFRESIPESCALLQTDETTLLKQLHILQSLEPCGVAARNVREALILQCQRSHNRLGEQLLREYAAELAEKNITAIAKGMRLSAREVKEVIFSLRSCTPCPCHEYEQDSIETILPELEICVEEERLQILPMRYGSTVLQEHYVQAIEHSDKLKSYFQEACLLFETLNRRNATLSMIVNELVQIQKGFFLYGDELQPCTLQQLADRLGLHVSTVSRALHNKYYLFEKECYAFHQLLSASTMQGDSSAAVQRAMLTMIQNEDKTHPLSDQQLVIKLKAMDLSVSRRAITKYRQQLHIPKSQERKRI